jgi:chaperonin GroEL (HSP60 family)
MIPDEYIRAVVRKRFPEATEQQIRAGYRRAAERFAKEVERRDATITKSKREKEVYQALQFELDEVALETGLVLGQDTPIGKFLEQAVAMGNERAARLLMQMSR